MATISNVKNGSTNSSKSILYETKAYISQSYQVISKKLESFKIATHDTFHDTAIKIKRFIKNHFKDIFFAILSTFALIHGPYRFLVASLLGLAIQKISYNEQKEIVTSNSLALNILATIGVILEKTICPVCDPTYYLAPCISGIVSTEAAFNLLQTFYKKEPGSN